MRKINNHIAAISLLTITFMVTSCGSGGNINQTTIKEISVRGTFYQMGQQYGTQEKNDLQNYYYGTMLPIYNQMESTPAGAADVEATILATFNTLPQQFKDFYHGMSDSTGLTETQIYKIAYFYNFNFNGCSSFAKVGANNNFVMHTYDGGQSFYSVLYNRTTILKLTPTEPGYTPATLVTFYGSLSAFVGINANGITAQMTNGMLSVPLPDSARIQVTKPQPADLLPWMLVTESNFSNAQRFLSTNVVSASATMTISDESQNVAIFYLIPYRGGIQQNIASIESTNTQGQTNETSTLNFITNTFLNNPIDQPIESQVFLYSYNNDASSMTFHRLDHISNFVASYNGQPTINDAYNFINKSFYESGVVMLSSEGLSDATYFRLLYSPETHQIKINQTYNSIWNTINVLYN